MRAVIPLCGRIGPVSRSDGLHKLDKEEPMKGLSAVLFSITLAVSSAACGQDKGKAPTEAQKKQQERMSACNKEAGEKKLKGDERKKFMNGCLKGGKSGSQAKAASPKQKAQQDKMGDCNKQANLKNMKGEDRKTFMSSCLKG
jgi:psiF repeat